MALTTEERIEAILKSGELAIHMALSQLLCRIKLFSKVVLFSDSLVTIQAIALQSAPLSTKVQKYKNTSKSLQQ